ncbi:SAM-dependent methyltransferase [Devosia sp. UYZn731]|uniref:class I SAM-dependent methyltransferase n=1 Tax=Devosia sp. UYZn731 TaxID=3156345 RepID=UPI00339A65BB
MPTERTSHWDKVYSTKGENEVSWFEDSPELSLALLDEAGLTPAAAIIDIGGGASRLVDTLIAAGQAHVSVLDLSSSALEFARARMQATDRVDWFVSDVTTWQPTRSYDLWHDRAAFHFLTAPADQQKYAEVMTQALVKGGKAIIGTFAPDGPEKCSGLEVARHDAESLHAIFGTGFKLMATRRHEHTTPWGSVQKFQFSTFEKVG